MQRSVARHARSISVPAQLTDQQAKDGLRIYKDTCIYCHGAPGKDPGDIGKGLNPEAPYLPDTVGRWSSAELFWIIKHGIKMTGTASYGAVHKDEEIWNLVAFVQGLPKMTPEQYGQMEQSAALAPLAVTQEPGKALSAPPVAQLIGERPLRSV